MKQCWSGSELVEFRTLSGDEKQLSEQRTQRVLGSTKKCERAADSCGRWHLHPRCCLGGMTSCR